MQITQKIYRTLDFWEVTYEQGSQKTHISEAGYTDDYK